MDNERPARNYGRLLRIWERVQAVLMPTDWPAELVQAWNGSSEVLVDRQHVSVAAHLGGTRPLTIGFASDFHAGPMTSARILERAATALADAAPDVLLLGGDFVSVRPQYVNRVADRLGQIPAPTGRFAVLGNHDHWAGGREVTRGLERAGIEVLTNRNRRLPSPFEQVTICGLDDHIAGYPDAAAAFAGATPVRLLLMHAPSGLLDIGEHRFTVAFAGHTHGGQIALRSGYPLYVPHGPLSRQYHGGRFQPRPGQVLLVSRGVGCSSVPFRWNVPPEVHLCSLQGSD